MKNASPLLCCLLLMVASTSLAEETFVTIHQVHGNQLAIVPARGGGMSQKGKGGGTNLPSVVIIVPSDAKITSAMREKRTFEFRVGAELAGGLRHHIFQNFQQPLSARIVTAGNRIVEINVLTPEIDINQTHTDASGQTVIAVRPKRPPLKKP